MLTQTALWLNVVFCCITIVILAIKRSYPVATLLLGIGIACLAGLNLASSTLLGHNQVLESYSSILLLQCGAVFGCYFYTKTAFRDNSEIYKGLGFWISLLLALGVLSYGSIVAPDQLIFSPDFVDEHIIYLTRGGFFVYLVLMLYLVFGLVQLERTLAGLHSLQRRGVKTEVLGAGILLAGMALYFSHSLLYRSLNLNYLGWRALMVCAALAMISYTRLSEAGSARLSLSRGIAHRSFVLLVIGGYLIILGLLGEGLRYLNLDNVKPLLYFLMLLGAMGLAVLGMSEKLRRWLKVTLHKNFYQSKYDYRQQWRSFAELVTANETLKELEPAILDLFCDNLACKGASLYLRDDENGGYHFSSAFNVRRDWRPVAVDDPLVTVMERQDWIVNLQEENPGLEGSIVKTFDDVGAFLVVPLHFDDQLVGFIILGEQINRGEELTYEDYDFLRMLGRQSVASIQGLRLSEQLSTNRELASIGKLSTFVLHDLKNQVSGLSLMLDNARDYIEEPDFQQDMLETVETTVKNMKGLIARLKNVKEKPQLAVSKVDLAVIVRDAVETAGGDIDVSGESIVVAADDEEIYKVVLNLLVNAKEASGYKSRVGVTYGFDAKAAFVCVSDDGCGMSQDFIDEKLFKPFETTKQHGFGIGLYQCRQIMEDHGGSINVESREDEGTTFTLLLPV